MTAKVTWQHNMTFTGTADSGFEVPLGASAGVGGNEDGFRPMELIATGLAGCTAMDVISILHKKRQKVTAFEVIINTDRAAEHPRVFTSAVIDYIISGQAIDEASVRRALELSAERYCPAQAMLSQVMPIELRYQIFEDEGDGKRRLVIGGSYDPSEAPETI